MATSRLDALLGWIRKNSLWPLPLGFSCCGVELRTAIVARRDLVRFGAGMIRFSPRQSDLMIVAGTITDKLAPRILRTYERMPEPKYVIAAGACACSGGLYDTYPVVQGLDRILPVDVYVPGCPPTPDALVRAVRELKVMIQNRSTAYDQLSAANGGA